MKKYFFISLITILLLFVSTFGIAHTNDSVYTENGAFLFPTSLETIEEEAFEGTSVKTIVFPDGFLSIGDNAFQNNVYLTSAYISGTVENIEDHAFPNNNSFSIYGIEGSYAQEWAEKNRIPFIVSDVWNVIVEPEQTINSQKISVDGIVAIIVPDKVIAPHERGDNHRESRRPQDRLELNPIDYRFP